MDWQSYETAHPIVVAEELADPHPITRCTAERYGFALPDLVSMETAENRYFQGRVSAGNADLALRIVDAFVRACELRGFELLHDPYNRVHNGLSVFIDGEAVPVVLREFGSRVTGLLLEYGRHSRIYLRKRSWKDHPRRPLAGKLNTVILALRNEVALRIAGRLADEEYDRRIEELTRSRQELGNRVQKECRAVEALYQEAEDRHRAQDIRAYVAAVEHQPVTQKDRKKRATWCKWAREQADRLDPLSPSPPSILDTPYDAYREPGYEEYLDLDGEIHHA